MIQLRWDNELEENAKLFASKCTFQHSSYVNPPFTEMDNVDYEFGENIAVESFKNFDNFANSSVNDWAEEYKYYNFRDILWLFKFENFIEIAQFSIKLVFSRPVDLVNNVVIIHKLFGMNLADLDVVLRIVIQLDLRAILLVQ